MQTRTLFITVGVIAAISMAAAAFANSISTKDFVRKASIANEFEIESSKLALEKSHNNEVREFAQRMVDDHTKTGEKLKETLHDSDVNAQPAEGLDAKHRGLLETLEANSGETFDRQYISVQFDGHKEAVNLFSDYSSHGKNMALRDFATQVLPTLKDHLKHIRHLKNSYDGK